MAARAAFVHPAPRRQRPRLDTTVLLSEPIAMITGMLATWKAAKLYVPLDHTLPPARLEVILRESETGLIVTEREGSAALPPLPGTSARQLLLDTVDLLAAVEPPRIIATPDTLACLLYTSGSTGKPKGVLCPSVPSIEVAPGHQIPRLASRFPCSPP